MKAQTIAHLAWYMPRCNTAARQSMCIGLTGVPMHRALDILHYADCHSNLKFGWDFASSIYNRDIPFPAILHGEDLYVWRAYNYLRGGIDPDIEGALSLELPARVNTRNQIRALLVCEGVDCEYVAAQLHMRPGVIKAYEKLFFNVLDRKTDRAFLASVVYPEGRLTEAFENYLENTGLGELMMRAGFSHGPKHVLYAAGLGKNPYATRGALEGATELDSMFMADGCLFATMGFMHQRTNAMPITNARLSMQASKMGNNNPDAGGALISVGNIMKDEIIRMGYENAEAQSRAMALLEASKEVPKNDTTSR